MNEHIIDGREMEAPEPFEATMAALDTLPRGEELTLLLSCTPNPLYRVLERNGFIWSEQWDDAGTNTIRIRHA